MGVTVYEHLAELGAEIEKTEQTRKQRESTPIQPSHSIDSADTLCRNGGNEVSPHGGEPATIDHRRPFRPQLRLKQAIEALHGERPSW